LRIDDLHHYIRDARSTWGGDYDFRHFLPRIMEIYALTDNLNNHHIYPEIVFGKLPYADWSKWPVDEQISFQQFLLALWKSKIDFSFPWDEYAPSMIEDWLTAMGWVEDDLHLYLSAWLDSNTAEAVVNLSHFILSDQEFLSKGKVQNTF
jgi:hypothetical protein